jgi:hypothetical protein
MKWYYPLVLSVLTASIFVFNYMAKRWLAENEGFDKSCDYRDITNRNLKL